MPIFKKTTGYPKLRTIPQILSRETHFGRLIYPLRFSRAIGAEYFPLQPHFNRADVCILVICLVK
jgi:hypothetical protein